MSLKQAICSKMQVGTGARAEKIRTYNYKVCLLFLLLYFELNVVPNRAFQKDKISSWLLRAK